MSDPAIPSFRYSLLLREINNLRHTDGIDSVALVLIRIAGLRAVNANFGYLGGDHVLEEMVRRITGLARRQDRVFPVHGATLALLIANPLNESHAVLAAERVIREVQMPVTIETSRARVNAHMGVSLLPGLATSTDELLRQCEKSLRAARRRDETCIVFGPELDKPETDAASQAIFDVDGALRQDQFELHYQPKLALASGQLLGAEALIRWRCPDNGLRPPAEFLPAIEQTRGIRSVLRFCLNAALRTACEWRERASGLSVAVNLSPANLTDPDLVDVVADALEIWGLPPDQLVLEVTETALMDDPKANGRTLRALRKLGLRLAIDDFGTGYSSLAYLRTIPAQELKIDRSFIATLEKSHRDRNIVASVIQLGHAVNMQVVAEGIETLEVLQTLVAMYCDIGQGYYFSKPLPADEFSDRWVDQFGRRARA
ncbi:MAG: GGDEF domain-containing phosphodiesterase [Gammaproteobacteria bacterium]|nr:GGDEF domain-containing phosphodiesterase [Gammaproteobacteria bacterium]